MSVIDLGETRAAREQAAWKSFCEASTRAQATHRAEDGIAAGRAWRAWLDLFMSHEQRDALDRANEAVTMRKRAP